MPLRRRPPKLRGRPRRPEPLPPLRVSVVRYLNTAPLVWGLEHGRPRLRYRLSYTTPAACADDLRAGRADLGIIPAIEYQRIPGLVLIPHLAVASERKVESVLLISRGPARRARRVALDTSSRTSAALVRILFARHWRREPEYVEAAPELSEMLEKADAALLIGDPALQFLFHSPAARAAGLTREPNLHVYDLAEEWWRLTNLPFVFALWAVRPEAVRAPRRRPPRTSRRAAQALPPQLDCLPAGRPRAGRARIVLSLCARVGLDRGVAAAGVPLNGPQQTGSARALPLR